VDPWEKITDNHDSMGVSCIHHIQGKNELSMFYGDAFIYAFVAVQFRRPLQSWFYCIFHENNTPLLIKDKIPRKEQVIIQPFREKPFLLYLPRAFNCSVKAAYL